MGHVHIKTTVSIKCTIIVIIWALCAKKIESGNYSVTIKLVFIAICQLN